MPLAIFEVQSKDGLLQITFVGLGPNVTLMLTLCYVTQTIPESVPELLKPDFSKLDIIKLKADIPKFPKAGVPKDKMEFWQNIEKHLHGIEGKSLPAEEWLLEVLQKRKMNQLQQHISSPSASPLPEELLSAHVKETAPLPEVRTLNHSATQLPLYKHNTTMLSFISDLYWKTKSKEDSRF